MDDALHCEVLTSYRGVNVYQNFGPAGFCSEDRCSYPRNGFGKRWQCVELFNRFFRQIFGTEHVPGSARDLLRNAARLPGFESHPDGGRHTPAPGDALVLDNEEWGHVAIITAVEDDSIRVVEQNVPGDGTNEFRYDRATNQVRVRGATSLGWIRAAAD